jgi:hypothetical protein
MPRGERHGLGDGIAAISLKELLFELQSVAGGS